MSIQSGLKIEMQLTGVDPNLQVELRFSGMMDESATLPELPAGPVRELIIDLDGVEHINSAGVRKWITWIWKLDKNRKETKIVLKRCRSAIVRQALFVREFLPPGATVESLYVSYFCPTCKQGQSELVDRTTVLKDGSIQFSLLEEREPPCPHCGTPMEFDTDPSVPILFSKD